MTVSSRVSSIIYVGDGSTAEFDVPFRFLEDSDLQLSIQATDGTVTNLVLNSDYTVSGANADNGGKVYLTHPVPAQSKLSILRVMDMLQEVDYRENERFPAESHERALDKLTMEVQQLQEQSDRAIKVDVFSDADPDALIQEIEIVYDNLDNINTVVNDKANMDTVALNIADVNTNANNMADIKTNATNINSIKTNANNAADINLLAENMKDINTVVTNMTAIQAAPTEATNAANSAIDSSNYANASAASAQAAQEAIDTVQGLIATPIGTIFMSIYVDESLDIARRLNGQLISSTKFTGFRTWLNDVQTAFPSLFTTETNWQSEKSLSKLGQCGKFVIDDTAGTIRLPCVVNAQGLTDLALIGTIKNESLPNITGSWDVVTDASRVSGSFEFDSSTTASGNAFGSLLNGGILRFSASRSSSTYQDNAPVQQEAVQYPYYIQVATGIEETLPAIREYKTNVPYVLGDSKYFEADPYNASWLVSNGQYNAKTTYPDLWTQLQVELNSSLNKGDTVVIDGKTYVKRGLPVVLSTGTITDEDFVVNQDDQTFRLPLKSKLASGSAVVGNGMTLGLTNGTTNFGVCGTVNDYWRLAASEDAYGNNVQTQITQDNPITGYLGVTTDPEKSGIETSSNGLKLYYYVGDTVQDASLINAGAVLGQLANKADIDASNFNADGKSLLSGLGAVSNKSTYSSLPLGASGTQYTAPTTGYVRLRALNSTYLGLSGMGNLSLSSYQSVPSATTLHYWSALLKKGTTYTIAYSGTLTDHTFITAEGDK